MEELGKGLNSMKVIGTPEEDRVNYPGSMELSETEEPTNKHTHMFGITNKPRYPCIKHFKVSFQVLENPPIEKKQS